MSYLVKLQHFEGPLDLLLHLISKAKVQIEDISITEITNQYLDTLTMMEQFDIEVASEFLVMAATLLHIKSCILVPKAKQEFEGDQEDTDPRQELITRLLEYKKFKEAGNKLKDREAYFSRSYYKLPEEIISMDKKEIIPTDLDIASLQEAFLNLLNADRNKNRKKIQLVHEIKRDPVTVNEKVNQLKEYFLIHSQTTFFQMFNKNYDRDDIIVTFLALLELLIDNFLDVYQNHPFGDIVIKRRA
ncbi:MAG: segregation and condensation protein A [Caldicoprobacterales bacterium]|jgi:segregation and condensation protein A